jgi:hypothetical protein
MANRKNKMRLLTRFNGMDEPDDLRKHILYQVCCFTDECIFAFCVQFVFVEMQPAIPKAKNN